MKLRNEISTGERLYKIFIYLVLGILAVLILIPVLWVMVASVKETTGVVDRKMNQLVIYLTEHQDYMNEKQVFEVKRIFDRFNHFLHSWKAEKPKFFIREEKIDQTKLINSIANELVAEKKN